MCQANLITRIREFCKLSAHLNHYINFNIMGDTEILNKIKSVIKIYPDFPKPGIIFRDINPLLKSPVLFDSAIQLLAHHIKQQNVTVDVVVGLETSGFIIGPLLAQKLNAAFVPIRKVGKLPGKLSRLAYSMEYGQDVMEIQKDSIMAGQNVIVTDDLLATGGTLAAACLLIRSLGAIVIECVTIIEIENLEGRKKIDAPVFSLLT